MLRRKHIKKTRTRKKKIKSMTETTNIMEMNMDIELKKDFNNISLYTNKSAFEKLHINKKSIIFNFLENREKFKLMFLNKNIKTEIESNKSY